ncbi:Glycine dehydrogenase [Eumeta japonica]|uniref:Glycine dehydrogenase n=1 Tax=Eumeta variegata TaxID=151549 RepID=A0A4C1SVC6_EUMVA|nr:Glycine dehydrogenase [Eumeta japonica]
MTSLDVANASLLDEGTAAAEAMCLCTRHNKRKKLFLSNKIHPQTLSVVTTRADALELEIEVGSISDVNFASREYSGILLQYPDTNGDIRDFEDIATLARKHGTLVVVATDLLSLTLLRPPAEFGADIAVGTSQRLGVPLEFIMSDDYISLNNGVFEETVAEICDLIHKNGGQVYLDGANMNAQVGLCRPGDYGSDVSHLNLHKTFCIPMVAVGLVWARLG